MWNRRRTLQTGLATLLSAAAPLRAFSQPKPRVKVRYNEVVRSVLYAPAYVAIAKGYFEELGMDVTLATAQGGDKSVAIMLSNQADIGAHRPGIGNLRSEQRFTGQDSDLLRAHGNRRLHAGRAREGRQIRLERAQGQGDPGLPARQHAAALSGGGAASERARSAKGREAHEQCRHPGARRVLAGGPEPIRHLHRAGCRAARARRQGALPRVDRRDRGSCRLHHLHGDRQIHPREQGDAAELDQRDRQGA